MITRYAWYGVLALFVVQALVFYIFGQPLISARGEVWLWASEPLSPDNSQHLADWYTFSHLIHGVIFYWLLGKCFPKLSMGARLVISTGLEVGWEMVENTPWLIEHYRQQALAQGYTGDSILNSISDTVAMVLGFFAAKRLPVWLVVGAAVVLEAVSLYFIRDSLILNMVNLIYPFEFLAAWQSAS